MAGVLLPATDVLPAGPHRDLVEALHELYGQAGLPGTRRISEDSWRLGDALDLPDTISHEGVSAILRGDGVPRWTKVECLVRILAYRAVGRPDVDTTVQRFHKLWSSVAGIGSISVSSTEVNSRSAPADDSHTSSDLGEDLRQPGKQVTGLRQPPDALEGVGYQRIKGLRRPPSTPSEAASQLAELLFGRGDVEGLRHSADTGNWYAVAKLIELFTDKDDLEGMGELADAGFEAAAEKLALLLAERNDEEGLRQQANTGNRYAVAKLIQRLTKRDDLEGLGELADAGYGDAARELASILFRRDDVEGLRRRAFIHRDSHAADRLSLLYEEQVTGTVLES